jgi:hypothetical protein
MPCGRETEERHENFGTRSRPGMSYLAEIWTLGLPECSRCGIHATTTFGKLPHIYSYYKHSLHRSLKKHITLKRKENCSKLQEKILGLRKLPTVSHCLCVEETLANFRLFILFCIPHPWRSQWPPGLRRRSAAARLLRLWVPIPPGAWTFLCCESCVRCQAEVSATSWSLVHRSPTDCGASMSVI